MHKRLTILHKRLERRIDMLPIFICEDEPVLLKSYTNYIQEYLSFHEYEMKIVCSTDDPHEILAAVTKDRQKGIYFRDIVLSDNRKKEGIYLGEKIRELDPDGYIVYITSHSELSMMVLRHRVAATDFIPKDDAEHLKKNIADVLNLIHERDTRSLPEEDILVLETKTEKIYLKQSDIYYIEIVPGARKSAVHTQFSIYETGESLKLLKSRLNSSFMYCHKSIIINIRHVQALQKRIRKITFDNNLTCDVAVRNLKEVALALELPK